jgi:hypothetical protein
MATKLQKRGGKTDTHDAGLTSNQEMTVENTFMDSELSITNQQPANQVETDIMDCNHGDLLNNQLDSSQIVPSNLTDGAYVTSITQAIERPQKTDHTPERLSTQRLDSTTIQDCTNIPIVSWDMVTAAVQRIQGKSLNTGLHVIPEVYQLVMEVERKLDSGKMNSVQDIIDSTFRK